VYLPVSSVYQNNHAKERRNNLLNIEVEIMLFWK